MAETTTALIIFLSVIIFILVINVSVYSYRLTDKKIELIIANSKIERLEEKNKTATEYFYHIKYIFSQMGTSSEKDKVILSTVYQALDEIK